MQISLLIVEDNQVIQDLFLRISQCLDCHCDIVSGGTEALKASTEKLYDLILMDCQLPDIDGFETTKRIRTSENKNKKTPIIAIPGQASQETVEECQRAGMNDFLMKPFEIDDLSIILERWVPQKSQDLNNSAVKAENKIKNIGNLQHIDLTRLRKISGGTRQGLRDLLNDYLNNISQELKNLEKAVNERSSNKIARYAHSCAGVSAFCGINILTAILHKIERVAENEDFDLIGRLYKQAESEFSGVKLEINKQKNN